MPPAVVDAINSHRAALLAREAAAMQAQAQAWLGVEQALQAQVDALALELARAPGRATMGQLSRSRRYRELMTQTRAETLRYADYMERRIVAGQSDMVAMALQHSAQAVNVVATEAGIVVPFNRLPVQAVNDMVGLAGDGSPLRDVLADASRVGPDALAQELVDGIALGRNPLDVARRAMRAGLGQTFTRMQNIARTEQLRVYRQVTLESYANSRVVVGYKRLSARDRRTCPACLMADGQQYPISHGFDEHPQGRCTLIPVLANVPPVVYETGQQWFRSQPEATQRAIVGPTRLDLWRRGEITLDDMVSRDWSDTWGGALRTTNVRDLAAGRGGVPFMSMPVRAPAPVVPTKPLVPAGKPINKTLDASLRLKKDRWNPDGGVNMKPVAREAADRISKVHGVGDAPPVSVQQMTAGEREYHGAAGLYNPETTRISGDPRPAFPGGDILLDTKLPALNQQASLTHEIGHYLDNKVIGKPGEWSSVSDPLFNEWRRAVDETKGIKTLKAYKADPALMEKETGIPRIIQPSDQAYDYLLDYRETWARSYAQYIAEKSGDTDLLTVHDSWTVKSQWDAEDFAPVAKAIDNLFLKLGWLK